MKSVKEQIHQFCANFVQERMDRIEQGIANIQESLSSETKSTAGDKHETGRAMLQLEREKAGVQLAEAQKLQEIVAKAAVKRPSTVVHLGSLVTTSLETYYICISAGKFQIKNSSFFAIAANTPIGQLLLGKSVGDHFQFRGENIVILEIQ